MVSVTRVVGLNYLFFGVFLDSNFLGASFLGASSSPPVFSRGSMDITFFGKICGKRMKSKGEKNYRKWCQNDQEGLKH